MDRLPSIVAPSVAVAREVCTLLREHGVQKSPLIKLNFTSAEGPEIYLKLETMQPVTSYKVRGALNAMVQKMDSVAEGSTITVVTASAGNMGQGVAFTANMLKKAQGKNIQCMVIVPEHAPETKLQAMRALGAEVVKVSFERWWQVVCEAPGDISAELKATEGASNEALFIHPVCEQDVVNGHGSCAIEIAEDLPIDEIDALLTPFGGGGFTCGVGSVAKELNPKLKVYSCEPITAAPMALSKETSKEVTTYERYKTSWVDGCGGKGILHPMWELGNAVVTAGEALDLDEVEFAVRLLLERNKCLAEGAGAISVAAALFSPLVQGMRKVVCVVSGGGLDTSELQRILQDTTPLEERYDSLLERRRRGPTTLSARLAQVPK